MSDVDFSLYHPPGGLRDSSELLTPFCIYVLLLRVVVALAVVALSLSQDTNPNLFKSPRDCASRAPPRRSAHSLASLHESLIKQHAARSNDTRPERVTRPTDRPTYGSLPRWLADDASVCLRRRRSCRRRLSKFTSSIHPSILLYSKGSRLSGSRNRMRQVSITSTLLSCIQSFSRSIDRGRRKGEDNVCRLGIDCC